MRKKTQMGEKRKKDQEMLKQTQKIYDRVQLYRLIYQPYLATQ